MARPVNAAATAPAEAELRATTSGTAGTAATAAAGTEQKEQATSGMDEAGMDEALRAIAEPRRREILRTIWTVELPAGEIAAQFAVTRPAISQHLKVLKDTGLVSERRAGTRRLYRARPERVAEVRAFLEHWWHTTPATATASRTEVPAGTTAAPAPAKADRDRQRWRRLTLQPGTRASG